MYDKSIEFTLIYLQKNLPSHSTTQPFFISHERMFQNTGAYSCDFLISSSIPSIRAKRCPICYFILNANPVQKSIFSQHLTPHVDAPNPHCTKNLKSATKQSCKDRHKKQSPAPFAKKERNVPFSFQHGKGSKHGL